MPRTSTSEAPQTQRTRTRADGLTPALCRSGSKQRCMQRSLSRWNACECRQTLRMPDLTSEAADSPFSRPEMRKSFRRDQAGKRPGVCGRRQRFSHAIQGGSTSPGSVALFRRHFVVGKGKVRLAGWSVSPRCIRRGIEGERVHGRYMPSATTRGCWSSSLSFLSVCSIYLVFPYIVSCKHPRLTHAAPLAEWESAMRESGDSDRTGSDH